MIDKRIYRINELYKNSQTEGLTEEEKLEQANLRKDISSNIRTNFRSLINNIEIENEHGLIESLGQKYGNASTKDR